MAHAVAVFTIKVNPYTPTQVQMFLSIFIQQEQGSTQSKVDAEPFSFQTFET